MNFGAYNGISRNNKPIRIFNLLHGRQNKEQDENKCIFNQKILDCIIDDDDSTFIELVSQIANEETNPNQQFYMKNYKLPKILRSRPTYASLCAFFNAEKCFTALSMLCPEGVSSNDFKLLDDDHRSPIHFACSGGSLSIIRELYKAGFDLNAEDFYGMQPSHYSAMFGTTDIMKYLWTKGASILGGDSKDVMTPLQVACLYGNLDIVKFICEKVDESDNLLNDSYHYYFFNSITPLHLACEGGHVEIVRYILSKKELAKKQISVVDNEFRTPLLVAVQNGSLECVKELFNFDANKKYFAKLKKHVALIDASAAGYIDIVKFLLEQDGVDINEINSQKLTALDEAILNGHIQIIELLLQKGAAAHKSEKEIGDLFLTACGTYSIDIVKYLDSRLDIPYKSMGEVFMRQACKIESKDLVNFLLSKNCSFERIDMDDVNFRIKWTPFMTFLKEKGFDFSNVSSKIGTPIIVRTVKNGSLISIKKLISEGVELNKEIIDRSDLVKLTCKQGKLDVLSFLLTYNPTINEPDELLNEVLLRFGRVKSRNNRKLVNEYLQLLDTFFSVYKADPNEKSNLSIPISNCYIEILEVFAKYGATFTNCIVDFSFFVKMDNYPSVLKYLNEKKADFNTFTTDNGFPLIVDAIKSNEMKLFVILIDFGVTFDSKLIDGYDLIKHAVIELKLQTFVVLLNFKPTISDPTSYLRMIYSERNEIRIVHNYESEDAAFQIAEILFREYHANANEESVIQFATSNCLIELLKLLKTFGADFNSCNLDYSKMITKKHIFILRFLAENGCNFQKAKKFIPKRQSRDFLTPGNSFEVDDDYQNVSPICINLQNYDECNYSVKTFLFLLNYATNDEITNFRIKKINFSYLIFDKDIEEMNMIDILFRIRCFEGIFQIYQKLNKIVFPLLMPKEKFVDEINKCNIQALKNMVNQQS